MQTRNFFIQNDFHVNVSKITCLMIIFEKKILKTIQSPVNRIFQSEWVFNTRNKSADRNNR